MSSHIFDKSAWKKRSLFDQMGNIGSEVGRAINAKKQGDLISMTAAFYRGLDLIDATTEGLIEKKSPRAKEVMRSREVYAASIMTDEIDPTIEKYFMEFAIAARRRR